MISDTWYTFGSDFVQLMWNQPRFWPEKYELKYACIMKHSVRPYYKSEEYIKTKKQKIHFICTSIRIPDLLPSSSCAFNLVAVYNPASIDPGIVITAITGALAKEILPSGFLNGLF